MNYSTDKPIENEKYDLLGRAFFSKQLANTIYNFNIKDGLVIGLFGKWGSGKTSVMNMTINEIKKIEEGYNEPIIMKFSPWNYSDKDNLINMFFESLKNSINIQKDENFKKTVGKALSDYAGIFEALSILPLVGSSLATILKTIAQVQGDSLMEMANLDKTRENLEKELIKATKKIVIVIDDIDRLTNSQIRDICQLVKQVADFPNVIYMLIMDRDIVSNALTEIHNIDGNEYLEKIIQVPFELPKLRKSKINSIFFRKLNQAIKDLNIEVILDENYWNSVFGNCIEPYINNLRDVNRLINNFQFRYGALCNETSLEDMIAITTIEVLEPKLYKWIYNNKDSVCAGFRHRLSSYGDNKPDYHELYCSEFENLGIDANLAMNFVSTIFPLFAKDVNKYHYIDQSSQNIREKMRIANEERFELYFIFDLDYIEVSRNTINNCINIFNKDQLIDNIEQINENDNIYFFIEEMESLVDKIPYDRLELIISVMISSQSKFKNRNLETIFFISLDYKVTALLKKLIKRLKTEEERYKIISSELKDAEKNSLGIMGTIINSIELVDDRLDGDSEKKDEIIITLDHLNELKGIYVERIKTIIKAESILEIDQFRKVFYLWRRFDKDGVECYTKTLFKSEINKLKFICAIALKWYGTNATGWHFLSDDYSEYISQKEICNIIQNFDKKKFEKFTEIEQIKLVSFVANCDKGKIKEIDEKEAQDYLDKWKIEKNT